MKLENPEFKSQNSENPGIFNMKSGKIVNGRFPHLKSVFLNQIINHVIRYLNKVYLNETKENTHQNIVNLMNKKL